MAKHTPEQVGWLSDQKNAIEALNNAMKHQAKDDFLFALYNVALAQGFAQLAEKTGLSREGLYKILQPTGDPRLSVLIAIMDAMNFEFQVVPVARLPLENQLFRKERLNSLAHTYPDLAQRWHSDRNGFLTPNDVVPTSRKRVWWKCDKFENHEWQDTTLGLINKIKDYLTSDNNFTWQACADEWSKICPKCTCNSFHKRIKERLMEKNIDFNGEYISKLGAGNSTFDAQLLTSIIHEAKNNPDCVKITYIHRNPLPIPARYDELFTQLNAAKILINKSLKGSSIKIISLRYPSTTEGWKEEIVWQREK